MLEIELSSFLTSNHDSDMLDEYDFSQSIRDKYAQRYSEGSNIVKLDDDVAEIFPDDKSVNDAFFNLRGKFSKFFGSRRFKLNLVLIHSPDSLDPFLLANLTKTPLVHLF